MKQFGCDFTLRITPFCYLPFCLVYFRLISLVCVLCIGTLLILHIKIMLFLQCRKIPDIKFWTASPVAVWLRPLIFSALNRSSSHHRGFELARVSCEISQALLVGGHMFFLGDIPFSHKLTSCSAQSVWNDLDGPQNPIENCFLF